jgi:hypothetical protein
VIVEREFVGPALPATTKWLARGADINLLNMRCMHWGLAAAVHRGIRAKPLTEAAKGWLTHGRWAVTWLPFSPLL